MRNLGLFSTWSDDSPCGSATATLPGLEPTIPGRYHREAAALDARKNPPSEALWLAGPKPDDDTPTRPEPPDPAAWERDREPELRARIAELKRSIGNGAADHAARHKAEDELAAHREEIMGAKAAIIAESLPGCWSADWMPHRTIMKITRDDGPGLIFHRNWHDNGRIEIGMDWPTNPRREVYRGDVKPITISDARPAAALARDIERRLLADGIPAWETAAANVAAAEAKRSSSIDLAAELAAILNAETTNPPHRDTPTGFAARWTGDNDDYEDRLEITGETGRHFGPRRIDLEIETWDEGLARTILAIVKSWADDHPDLTRTR